MPEPVLRHLNLPNKPKRLDSIGRGRGKDPRSIDRTQHGAALRLQLEGVETETKALEAQRIKEDLPSKVDLILEITSAAGYSFSTEHLNNLTTGSKGSIVLLNARPVTDENGSERTTAILHVKYGCLKYLAEKAQKYHEEKTKLENTPYPWLADVEYIGLAALKGLWTDTAPLPEDDKLHWWEFWIQRNPKAQFEFDQTVTNLGISVRTNRLTLPEHVIAIGQATREQIENSIELLNTLAEIRKARPCNIELSELSGYDQFEYIDDALDRIEFPSKNAPAVCLIDSGINRGHKLIKPLLSEQDNQTIFGDSDSSDCWEGGHGTPMAGLAAYGDLRNLLESAQPWIQSHWLEGVRLIDPKHPHEPDSYGAVTQQAILRPETTNHERTRIFTLAITAEGLGNATPSSWSAAVDAAAFGAEERDEPKRLIFVSAGNVEALNIGEAFSYPYDNFNSVIEDPAQAWNAITVGAISHRRIKETDPESRLLEEAAQIGGLSPFSRTSCEADEHWPIKPEIVMEGGNVGIHPENGPESRDSLDLLSTAAHFDFRPICSMRATSAATALAGRLAAQLCAEYPKYWPETIRGLVVNSAKWNEQMLDGLNPFNKYTGNQRKRLIHTLKCYGFGEPSVARAQFSSQQAVTMIREDSISPYKGKSGSINLNDCHIHRLKLPTGLIEDNAATTCRLKVTLSYFAAPNPSASNRIPGSRYRYAGNLLRFSVRHKDESPESFEGRVAKIAAEESSDSPEPSEERLYDDRWAIGSKLRGKAGSLVQDVWQGSVADLLTMDQIAVFPVKGWWAFRKFKDEDSPWHDCHLREVRYSLIVSIEVDAEVELYDSISNLITPEVDVNI